MAAIRRPQNSRHTWLRHLYASVSSGVSFPIAGLSIAARLTRIGMDALVFEPSRCRAEVAAAIVELVEQAPGTRPVRKVVDRFTGEGVTAIGVLQSQVQAQVFTAFGLSHLLTPKVG